MPLRFVWGIRATDNGKLLDPGDKGDLELDPSFNIATTKAQRWLLQFCDDLQKQPFYRTPGIGQLQLSSCFMQTFKDWMDRRCFDDLAMIDHGQCCEVTRFPYPEPIFSKCLIEAIGDLYDTPTDFWRPGVAGPKFNISTDKVEAMVVEFDSNAVFSFSHTKMDLFYKDVEMWFAKVILTAPDELRSGFFISHLGFYDVQNSLTWDTISAIGIALSATFVVLVIATRNISLTVSAAATVCATIFVTVGILVLIFDWKLNILESVAITLSIGLSVDFSLHYAITYRNASTRDGSNVEKSVIYAVVNMAAPVSMAALTTLLAGICLLPTRVLAYIQIGTFITILMSTSWIFSTFFFHALLRIIGRRGKRCERVTKNKDCENILDQEQPEKMTNGTGNDTLEQDEAGANNAQNNNTAIATKETDTIDPHEKLYAVSDNTVTHAVSIANGNGRSNKQQLREDVRRELQQKVDKITTINPQSIDYSSTIMITQEMLNNGATRLRDHPGRLSNASVASYNKLNGYSSPPSQQMSPLQRDKVDVERTDHILSKDAGSTPKRNISIYNYTECRISPTIVIETDNMHMNDTLLREHQNKSRNLNYPLSSIASDGVDSPVVSKEIVTRYVRFLILLYS